MCIRDRRAPQRCTCGDTDARGRLGMQPRLTAVAQTAVLVACKSVVAKRPRYRYYTRRMWGPSQLV
eukprot:6361284-Alexandrium_andersonii.AAC.1